MEAQEQKKSEVLRQQFTGICAQLGQLEFQISLLKAAQADLNAQYNAALKEETPEVTPAPQA